VKLTYDHSLGKGIPRPKITIAGVGGINQINADLGTTDTWRGKRIVIWTETSGGEAQELDFDIPNDLQLANGDAGGTGAQGVSKKRKKATKLLK